MDYGYQFGPYLPSKQFGPVYPKLGSKVDRMRRIADRHCIAAFKRIAQREHGAAVLEAIRAKQKAELARETKEHKICCASGTLHTTGEAILAAVRAQNKASATSNYAFDYQKSQQGYEMAMEARNMA